MNALLESLPELGYSRRVAIPFESAIENARVQTHSLNSKIAQFETILIFYKHGVELPHLINESADEARDAQHKSILSSLMSLGLMLLSQCKTHNLKSQCDFGRLQANVRYLQEKYEDWFVEYDKDQAKEDFRKIVNG
jgi:hypothetical protein